MVKQLPADEYIPAEVVERCPVCDRPDCMFRSNHAVGYDPRWDLADYSLTAVMRELQKRSLP